MTFDGQPEAGVPTLRQIDVRGKVAVITGAVSGIGAALAERLAARGARMVLSDISSTTLHQVADRVGATPVVADVAASKHAVVAVAEQTALALADSPIRITVLCPPLVRSGMSEVGDDPLDVADEALAALADRRFTVVPESWRRAVRERGERLALGLAPVLPEPS